MFNEWPEDPKNIAKMHDERIEMESVWQAHLQNLEEEKKELTRVVADIVQQNNLVFSERVLKATTQHNSQPFPQRQ